MPAETWAESRAAFREAAGWYVDMVALVRDRWDEPGLGEWTVRDLVGHTSRSLLTVEAYLGQPVGSVEVTSAVDYYLRALGGAGDPAAVAQRGRDAGVALGGDIVGAVAALADRVLALVDATGPDALVATPVGGMRLTDYLPTRTFELTVHTGDLAVALGVAVEVPLAAAAASLDVLGRLAARTGSAGTLLLAATGRKGLPSGFSVLPGA